MYVSVAVECSSSGTPIQLPLVHALGPKPANPINARFHARLETCTCFGFSIPYLRDIANFQTVLSPYKRDAKRHIERFHVSSSIVLQEALHLTTTPVFSSNDSSSTPHSPSATPQLQRHPRRPCCRQEDPSPSCSIFGKPSFVDHPRTLLSSGD